MAVRSIRSRSSIFVSFTGSAAAAATRLIHSLHEQVEVPEVVARPYGADAAAAFGHVREAALDECAVWILVLAERRSSTSDESVEDRAALDALWLDLETALEDDRVVAIWVLVGTGARVPDISDLRPRLSALAAAESCRIEDLSWDENVATLVSLIERQLGTGAYESASEGAAPADAGIPPPIEPGALPPSARRPLPSPAPAIDEHVQFTVYRRTAVQPDRWYPLLVFAHLSERRADAPPDEPDPIAEVQAQAAQVLGDAADFRSATEDSAHAVLREGELRFVPRLEGVTFNPVERRFLWTESVHREDFRMRADAALDGRVARGAVSVYAGNLLLADVQVSVKVSWQATDAGQEETHARPYRRIFASYAHRDTAVVEEFEAHAAATGDKYLRDVVTLRAGEVWDQRLMEMIRQADIFQLFWSWNALASPLVREEWQHALSLRRPHFVRPVYWEEPLPEQGGLPPHQLRRLHFQRVYPKASRVAAVPAAGTPAAARVPPPAALPPATVPPAPAVSPMMRYVRYGSVAAAAVLAVGLYVAAFGSLALPPPPEPDPQGPLPQTTPSDSGGSGAAAARPHETAVPQAGSAPPSEAPGNRGVGAEGAATAPRGGAAPTAGLRGRSPAPTSARPGSASSPASDSAVPPSAAHRPAPPRPRPAGEPSPTVGVPPVHAAVPVTAALRAYEAAWISKDRTALQRVWRMSDADIRQIDALFDRVDAVDVTVQLRHLEMQTSTRARAQVEETRRTRLATGRGSTTTSMRTFDLERRDQGWVIVAID